MGADRVTVRPARLEDLPACHGVFCRAEGAVLAARGYPWSDPPFERFARTQRHILVTDPQRYLVAETAGAVVGFTSALGRGDWWFLSALFIDPGHQGGGLGRRLFEAVVEGAPRRRMTITDAIQPISNTLYARHGLLPLTPLLTLEGTPTVERPTDLEPSGPGSADEIAALDAAASGVDRTPDHAYWLSRAERTVWRRRGVPVAYAYVWPDGQIGPLAARDRRSAGAALCAVLGACGSGPVSIAIPGSSQELLATALEAGLRITAPPGLLLLSRGYPVPRTLAISPSYFLP